MIVSEYIRAKVVYFVFLSTCFTLRENEAATQNQAPSTDQKPLIDGFGVAIWYISDEGTTKSFGGPLLRSIDPTDGALLQPLKHGNTVIYESNPCKDFKVNGSVSSVAKKDRKCKEAALKMYDSLKTSPSPECGTIVKGKDIKKNSGKYWPKYLILCP